VRRARSPSAPAAAAGLCFVRGAASR
jgi:hypothetical protein